MISINVIIFSNYIIGKVYCENQSHPWRHVKHSFHPPDIRHPDSKIRAPYFCLFVNFHMNKPNSFCHSRNISAAICKLVTLWHVAPSDASVMLGGWAGKQSEMVQEARARGAALLRDDQAASSVWGSVARQRPPGGGQCRQQPDQQRADGPARGAETAERGQAKSSERGDDGLSNSSLGLFSFFSFFEGGTEISWQETG